MMPKDKKIVITGAAGLVGQNLVLLLQEQGYGNIVAIDKNEDNLKLLKKYNPNVTTILADLAKENSWEDSLISADCLIMLHAQITGIYYEEFVENNIRATEKIVEKAIKHKVPYTVHISSSVVNSVADDFYTNTKTAQEKLVLASGIKCCVLRPTLMFGWFDPKHLGWLSKFMERVPFFPIPGHGKYLRQPLYSRDFCKIIIAALEQRPQNQIFDIVGQDQIDYIDMIKTIKRVKNLKTSIIKIPYWLFYALLKIYAIFNKKPPFTAQQLTALTAGDFFTGVDALNTFGVQMTTFEKAIEETFNHPVYSQVHVGIS